MAVRHAKERSAGGDSRGSTRLRARGFLDGEAMLALRSDRMADLPVDHESEIRLRPDDAHDVDMSQLVERLRWTPRERLRYFLDMVEFVELARRARRVAPDA